MRLDVTQDPDGRDNLFLSPPEWWDLLKPAAREMRQQPTGAEDILWSYLRNRQLAGFKFRRQHAVDRFILDFYCRAARLAVEVDGPIHECTAIEDAERDNVLARYGIRILRVRNEEVFDDIGSVLGIIHNALLRSEGV